MPPSATRLREWCCNVPEYVSGPEGWFHLSSNEPIPVEGYEWALWVSSGEGGVRLVNDDSVTVVSGGSDRGLARVRVGSDTLVFDLRPIAKRYAHSAPSPMGLLPERLLVEDGAGHRGTLVLTQLSGHREAGSLRVVSWTGTLLLGP